MGKTEDGEDLVADDVSLDANINDDADAKVDKAKLDLGMMDHLSLEDDTWDFGSKACRQSIPASQGAAIF